MLNHSWLISLDSWPFALWAALLLVGALVLGSFATMVIYRLPRILLEQASWSLSRPRSFCPACLSPLRWYQNLPLVGFLLLRGRCGSCQAKIPLRYPLIELGSLCLGVWALWSYPVGVLGLSAFVWLWCLWVLAWIDYEHGILPDEINFLGLLTLLALLWVFGPQDAWPAAILGLVGPALLLALVGFGVGLVRGESALGLGDVKLIAFIGLWLGFQNTLWVLVGASILGILHYLIKRAAALESKKWIHFGPYLVAASFLAEVASRLGLLPGLSPWF